MFVKVPEEVCEEDYKLGNYRDQKKFKNILLGGARKLGVEGDIGFGFSLIPIVLQRSSRSIYERNILVIGDARHATTPRVALGANVAIMDAIRAAHTIVTIHNGPSWRAQLARAYFSWHSWLGTHLLTLLGRITTTSQAIKSGSRTKKASAITRAYKFWKTQLLMSLHWRAGRGKSRLYSELEANKLLSQARSNSDGQLESHA